MKWLSSLLVLIFLMPSATLAVSPKVLVDDYALSLVAREPEIVTPVSIEFDAQGRLLVIESHTHQRPEGYTGPPADRIRMIDVDQDPARVTTFYDQSKQTMSIKLGPDGLIYVATRREIFTLLDSDKDGKADKKTTLVYLETEGDYPHNGLSGLVFSPTQDGSKPQLYFGMGENLGVPYKVVGSDGGILSSAGAGGHIFQCNLDGSNVMRHATGFWNPFGNCFDTHGRLFSIDNDPDASPPCRLVHVVPTADYGYQFRYGRSGRHPLQAWDGQLPGTLGMAAGTGEAPSGILALHGQFWVTSWGDHRIETFRIQPNGAQCFAQREIIVQGDQNFRPVGIAVAKDGSIYFSDWVDRSYPVHGRGKVWRLKPNRKMSGDFPPLSDGEKAAQELRREPDISKLNDRDAYIRQAVVMGLHQVHPEDYAWDDLKTANERLGYLQALNWSGKASDAYLEKALADDHDDVRLYALRIISDERKTEWRARVTKLLDQPIKNSRMLSSILAVIAFLDEGERSKDTKPVEAFLSRYVFDETKELSARIAALRILPIDHSSLSTERLEPLIDPQHPLSTEVVRLLAMRANPNDQMVLRRVAASIDFDIETRADSIAGFDATQENLDLLKQLSTDRSEVIQNEARRTLRHLQNRGETLDSRPPANDLDAWLKLVEQPGNAAAGRRIFFRGTGSQCVRCHQHSGRGSSVGPDLSTIHDRADKRRLLQSILTPSQEVSPRYTPTAVLTTDGTTFIGMEIEGPGDKGFENFLQADGKQIAVSTAEIESRKYLETSIMPSGFDQQLSVNELRDLIAFLMNK